MTMTKCKGVLNEIEPLHLFQLNLWAVERFQKRSASIVLRTDCSWKWYCKNWNSPQYVLHETFLRCTSSVLYSTWNFISMNIYSCWTSVVGNASEIKIFFSTCPCLRACPIFHHSVNLTFLLKLIANSKIRGWHTSSIMLDYNTTAQYETLE